MGVRALTGDWFGAVLLVAVALAFAFVTGLNDGASLIAISMANPQLHPLVAVGSLTLAVVVVPLAVGTAVADTFVHGLVDFSGRPDGADLLLAAVAALAVVLVLSRSGLPTSLTLALIGATVGGGLGLGLTVAWGSVAAVLAVAALAVTVSVLAGLVALRLIGILAIRRRATSQWRVMGSLAFLLQAIAYAANDAQKMLALLAVALGVGVAAPVRADPGTLALIGVMFLLGTLAGIERVAARIPRRVLPGRVQHVVAAEVGSSATVLVSAGFGVPVSMIHAATAALMGAAISETVRRVRWEQAARIAVSWLVTLPAAALAGAGMAMLALLVGR